MASSFNVTWVPPTNTSNLQTGTGIELSNNNKTATSKIDRSRANAYFTSTQEIPLNVEEIHFKSLKNSDAPAETHNFMFGIGDGSFGNYSSTSDANTGTREDLRQALYWNGTHLQLYVSEGNGDNMSGSWFNMGGSSFTTSTTWKIKFHDSNGNRVVKFYKENELLPTDSEEWDTKPSNWPTDSNSLMHLDPAGNNYLMGVTYFAGSGIKDVVVSYLPENPVLTDANIKEKVVDYIEHPNNYAPIGEWDVSKITNMSGLFQSTSFNEDISNWDTGNVTDMSKMFDDATAFNQNLSTWKIRHGSNLTNMFASSNVNYKSTPDLYDLQDFSYNFF